MKKSKPPKIKLKGAELAASKARELAEKESKLLIKRAMFKAKHQKIEAKPLTDEQVTQFVLYYNKHKKFPS